MMNKLASALMLGAMLTVAGGALADDGAMAKMPMKDMVMKMPTDKNGMLSVQQMLEMERARMMSKMKEMGVKGDKMTPTQWEKFYEDQYRGI